MSIVDSNVAEMSEQPPKDLLRGGGYPLPYALGGYSYTVLLCVNLEDSLTTFSDKKYLEDTSSWDPRQ